MTAAVDGRQALAVQRLRFASDAAGRISWVGGALAPMLVGFRLGQHGPGAVASSDEALIAALAERRPIIDGLLTLEGAPAVRGRWRVTATPRFDPGSGAFAGYHGVLANFEGRTSIHPHGDEDGEVLSLILHELRTPVNAIQGFAELIRQELFGPAPDRCRQLAEAIAADAAEIVAVLAEFDHRADAEEPARGPAPATPRPQAGCRGPGERPLSADLPSRSDAG